MHSNRIVTGHTSSGRSAVISCGPLPDAGEFVHFPGFSAALVWQTAARPQLVDQPEAPAPREHSVLPEVGGTCALLVSFPPDARAPVANFDPLAAAWEMCERLPGLGERFEPDNPGFHRTDTIDYGVVIDGEIWLELDEGCISHLRQGDVVVQTGTRHAWRNRSDKPARMLFVLIGAVR